MFDIVIGHSSKDEFRAKNLAYSLGYYYKKCPMSKIIIVEQNSNTNIKSDDRIVHLKINTGTFYNRGLGFNEGMKHATKPNILLVDNDCILDPKILDNIGIYFRNSVLIPYNNCIDLNKPETDHIMKMNRVIGGRTRGAKNSCVGGALFISRQLFDYVNGYEEMTGWGAEDESMFHKLKILGYDDIRITGDFPMFHLYHPSAVSKEYLNSEIYKKNLEKLEMIKNMNKEQLLKYLGK